MNERELNEKRPNLRIVGDFNGLGGRMAKLKHKEILHRSKDLVRKIRAQGHEPVMRMSCVCEATGMTPMDLAIFICMGLIRVDSTDPNPMLMVEDVLAVVQRALDLQRAGEIGELLKQS